MKRKRKEEHEERIGGQEYIIKGIVTSHTIVNLFITICCDPNIMFVIIMLIVL